VHNTPAVTTTFPDSDRVATLWQLAWTDDSVLACCVYRLESGMQLRVESATALIVCEPFELHPRAVARAHALRESLMRRGWVDRTGAETSLRPVLPR
jgi:hypothetical protein